jgi:EAL domain-containing protein (putative c-di-GMP-specific phosphodiesterase class I)
LSYLRRFPFDKIKIDRSFINGLTQEDSSSSIVRAILAMATEHKMVTTAEGVETEAQRKILRELGCTEMQGFLFSRPCGAAQVRRMMLHAENELADLTV